MAQDEGSQKAAPTRRGRRDDAPVAAPQGGAAPAATEPAVAGLSPDALARALRAVAAELERDPALARRVASAMSGVVEAVEESPAPTTPPASPAASGSASEADEPPAVTIGRTFHPSLVTGVAADLGAGVPDPFELRARLGPEGLRQALESLRLGTLRAIIREHNLDPNGRLSKQNDAARLRERIAQAVARRS